MKINRKNIIIAVVVIFFLIGIIPKIARYITTSLNAKETQYVAFVEKPRISDGADSLELSGELKPFLQTEIFSRINGLVKDRYVQLGEKVKKGQLLAEIDTPDLDAEAASSKWKQNISTITQQELMKGTEILLKTALFLLRNWRLNIIVSRLPRWLTKEQRLMLKKLEKI